MRVNTRSSIPIAGNLLLLRVMAREWDKAEVPSPVFDMSRLKREIVARTGPGRDLSRRKLSMMATSNKNPDLIRDLLSRGQDRKPSFEAVAGIAQALGLSTSDFIIGPSVAGGGKERIAVVGQVQAGSWREAVEWAQEDQYDIEVDPSPVEGAARFGLEMLGVSMDKVIPPGSVLTCLKIDWHTPALKPIDGDIVIVERRRSGLFETTCKRLRILADGRLELVGESSRAEYEQPIYASAPDEEVVSDDGVDIVAIVEDARQRHFRRR